MENSVTTKLYVGNLSFSTDDAGLAEVFADFGELQEVKVVQDRDTGRSRGFGFVTFASEDDAQKALSALNGKEVHGRSIAVSFAQEKPRSDRGPRSFGDRNGGGGGGGGGGRGGFSRGNGGGNGRGRY